MKSEDKKDLRASPQESEYTPSKPGVEAATPLDAQDGLVKGLNSAIGNLISLRADLPLKDTAENHKRIMDINSGLRALRESVASLTRERDAAVKALAGSVIETKVAEMERDAARKALEAVKVWRGIGLDSLEHFEEIGEMFRRDTGFLRPGKSEPMETYYEGREDERRKIWQEWCEKKNQEINNQIAAALSPISPKEASRG